MTELRAPGKRDITLGAVQPSYQVEVWYRRALEAAIARMTASYEYWTARRFKRAVAANVEAGRLPDRDAALAQDASPFEDAQKLQGELGRLQDYWDDYFTDLARKLAAQAVDKWYDSNATSWRGKLKRAGFDIQMQVTPAQKLVLMSKIPENVALIRSIQQDYHKDIQGIVTRNFLAGRDLAPMAAQIKKRGEVSTRRAALIARDQSNKASAQLNATRQRELGIRWALWRHSSAGKEPRPEHQRASREDWYYDVNVGIDFGDGFGYVLPSEAINCFPGESQVEIATGYKKLWRRDFRGKLAVVVTSSGKTFRATSNHPVLTPRGWVHAGALQLGDDLIGATKKISYRGEVDIHQHVASFQDHFSTAASYIAPVIAAGSTAQFHGDGADGDIQVIDIDGFLPFDWDAARCKHFAELLFSDADAAIDALAFGRDCALEKCLTSMTFGPYFVVRGASALLPLLKGHTSGGHAIRERLAAWCNTLFEQSASNNVAANFVPFAEFQFTGTGQVIDTDLLVGKLFNMLSRSALLWQGDAASADELGNRDWTEPYDIRGVLDAEALREEIDSVVDLAWVDFDGHVYNLESEFNWYTVETHIVHNCRCTGKSIIPGLGRAPANFDPDKLEAVPGFPGAWRLRD